MPDEVLVDDLVRVVMVHHDDGDLVDLGHLQRREILLGRAVVGQEDERELLPEPGMILQGEIEVPGDVLDLVEGGFRGGSFEEVVIGVEVTA